MTATPLTYYQKETLFDIGFNLGHAWRALPDGMQERIMNSIGGSRSLAEQAMLWAEEFDKAFSKKLEVEPDCDTYMEDIDDFFHSNWEVFIAGHVADRLTEGVTQ